MLNKLSRLLLYDLLTSARFIAGFVLDGKLEFENMYKNLKCNNDKFTEENRLSFVF